VMYWITVVFNCGGLCWLLTPAGVNMFHGSN
jgi:hypothetical protein